MVMQSIIIQCVQHFIYIYICIYIYIYIYHILTFCYDAAKRSRPSWPRDTANRSDLTFQGGPNQHGTYLPRRTIHTNHSPPRLELQDRPNIMVSRAQRETTKSKHMQSHFSATTRPPQEVSWSPVLSKQGSTRLTGFDYLLLPACD